MVASTEPFKPTSAPIVAPLAPGPTKIRLLTARLFPAIEKSLARNDSERKAVPAGRSFSVWVVPSPGRRERRRRWAPRLLASWPYSTRDCCSRRHPRHTAKATPLFQGFKENLSALGPRRLTALAALPRRPQPKACKMPLGPQDCCAFRMTWPSELQPDSTPVRRNTMHCQQSDKCPADTPPYYSNRRYRTRRHGSGRPEFTQPDRKELGAWTQEVRQNSPSRLHAASGKRDHPSTAS